MHGAPPVKSSRSDSSLDIRNVKSADIAPAYSTDKYLSTTSGKPVMKSYFTSEASMNSEPQSSLSGNRTALGGSIHRGHSAHDVSTRNLKLRVPDDYWKSSDPLVDFILMDHQYCEQNAISMLTSSAAFSKADLCFLFNREDEKMTRFEKLTLLEVVTCHKILTKLCNPSTDIVLPGCSFGNLGLNWT